MKKLLIFSILISLNINSFNLPDVKPENIVILKQHVAAMHDNAQNDINKNMAIATAAGMISKATLIGSLILLTSNRPQLALAAACAHGISETVWHTYNAKATVTRNALIFEFFERLLTAQNALPNDKNQQ